MAGFRVAHAYLWRALCLSGSLLLIAYFTFCVLFLGLRYGILPNIDHYKPRIEELASATLGQPVSISHITASWSGLTPRLALTDVVIHDKAGVVALRLPKVSAALSWWSVIAAEVRLDELEIDRPDLDIRRDADGRLFVAGMLIDNTQGGDGRGADWVLSQHRIVIRDGRVRWNDKLRDAPELVLENLDFRLENGWQKHAFALKAVPPAALAAPLDLRGVFFHPAFSRRISDFSKWNGTLYADVRSPALAGWAAYFDYPIALHSGSGGVRSWLLFDHRKVADFTADLHLADVSARLAPELPLLELVAVDGRVSVREEIRSQFLSGKPKAAGVPGTDFGANGHTIALTGFSMTTLDGLRLPTTSISETYVPARNGQPEQVSFTAKLLDLKTLASLVERMPVTPAQRRMIQDFAPEGTLQDFSASWQGTYPEIASYAAKGNFSNLSMQSQPARAARLRSGAVPAQAAVPAIPGFDNLSGSVDANDRGGAFALASSNLKLHAPGYFAEPVIGFDQLDMQANWSFQRNDQLLLEIRNLAFAKGSLHGTLSGRHLMPLNQQRGKPLGTIDISGDFHGLAIAEIDTYLPLVTPAPLRHWLTGALVGGTLQDTRLRLKGDLADFPFKQTSGTSAANRPVGEFNVTGRIEGGRLNVAPGEFGKDGKAPMWPLIEAIQGTISFDRTRMEINAKSARIHNVATSAVAVAIPDLMSPDLQLTVDGTAAGALQELIGFVNDSPVADWIDHFTEETRATGNAVLGLKLQLPLARLLESKVQGTLQLATNDVALQKAIPTLQQASGKLDFNEKGITLNGMKANFVGGPVAVSGGSQRDGAIVIKAEGSVTSDGLRRTFAAPVIKRVADRINGGTRYGATIAVRKKRLEILVESSLQGVALDFPAPLRKSSSEILPLKFEITGVSGDDSIGMRDEIRVGLGPALSARYQRQKSPEKNASWRVTSGGIGVNVPAPQPDGGVNINVSLKTLNIDAWRDLVATITAADKPAAGTAGQSPAAGLPATDAISLNQYLEPEVLSARATELIVAGKKLDNVVVGVSQQKGVWQANIDAVQASGYLTWSESSSGQGLGKVTARLSSLTIPKAAASEVTEILEGKNNTTQIPALDIVAEKFELFGKQMGRVELVAANKMGPFAAREWRIDKLSLTNADAELKATGSWNLANGEGTTSLAYRLAITNAGKLLERFGYANVLKDGKGVLDGDVRWKGMPFALDVPSLGGEMRIDMAAGQFLKVDPGAAKLLGVLSLQSLPRRLTLDFRDVFSQGFAFDGITGDVVIAQGAATTTNLKMRSVAATVIMDGSADIARETQDLHVAVIPEINVGTASVVYALAVNPVIGLGTFLAQLFLRDPLMRAFTFEYRITGPWTAPQVVKVDRNGAEIPAVKLAPQLSAAG